MNNIELDMKVTKLELKDGDILHINIATDQLFVDTGRKDGVSDEDVQKYIVDLVNRIYPDIDIPILINMDIEQLDEKRMNELGWYKKEVNIK